MRSYHPFELHAPHLLLLLLLVSIQDFVQAQIVTKADIHRRSPAEGDAAVSIAPQTTLQKGEFSTRYPSYSGLSANSAVTETVAGTPTVVPLWYCGPSATAKACKSCPTAESRGDVPADCSPGFNALVLVPVAAVLVGGIVPPPAGLPTLTIGPDGAPTEPAPEPTSRPDEGTAPTASASSTDTSFTIVSSCIVPSVKAADLATDPPSLTTVKPITGGTPAPTPDSDDPMPILQIKTEDPDHPGAYMTCGQSRNPYWNGGFLQFGSSFSRTDGINAIKQFCNDQADKKRIVGKKGIIPSYDSSRKAIPLVVSSYQNQHDDNKVMVRMQIDEENWNGGIGDCGESDKTFFDFGRDPRTDVVNNCIRMFGQTVEYCDRVEGKESTDPSVKLGGMYFQNCTYFVVAKSPLGGDSMQVP